MFDEIYMNAVYNASDCLLQTSRGESFGIPIVEAQFAGCPVIATDCSSMSELVFSGIKVPGRRFMFIPETFWVDIDIQACVSALASMKEQSKDPAIREKALEVRNIYEADIVFEKYMVPILEDFVKRTKK
jgi:glycosyltransferase involved in cell wall biosynthesis